MAQSVLHWGPLVALAIIVAITTATTQCALALPPRWALAAPFLVIVGGILYCFFRAIYAGAGTVPRGWVRATAMAA